MFSPTDSTCFRYRYEFRERPLVDFITDRYRPQRVALEEILTQRIRVNGVAAHPERLLAPGDWIEYTHYRSDEEITPPPLQVIFENEFMLAISKPDNLPVTPSGSYYFNSLAVHMKELTQNPEISPLHRLDLETSGVLMFGKTKETLSRLQPLFERKKMDKTYQALVFGTPQLQSIEGNLVKDEDSLILTKQKLIPAEKPTSHTDVIGVETFGEYSLVTLKPITGKTNQIRAHMAAIGHSLVGDKKYHPDESVYLDWYDYRDLGRILERVKLPRQALHCASISFADPLTNQELTLEDPTQPITHWLAQLHP